MSDQELRVPSTPPAAISRPINADDRFLRSSAYLAKTREIGVPRGDYLPQFSGLKSAVATFARVEQRVSFHEEAFGRSRLAKFVASVPSSEVYSQTSQYRKFIRSNPWPDENRPTSFKRFLLEYERSTIAYIDTSFRLLQFLDGSRERALADVYHEAVASEAVRSQFSKRCATGLDVRLETTAEELEPLLANVFSSDETQNAIDALCTPVAPYLTAEAALLEEFVELQTAYPFPFHLSSLFDLDRGGHDVGWRFLRRRAQWSAHRAVSYYEQFSSPHFEQQLSIARLTRCEHVGERQDFIAHICKIGDHTSASEILRLADEAAALNYLNLALEPCFNFKGGPGLAHGLIFQAALKLGLTFPLADKISNDKWHLFEATQMEEESEWVL